MHKAWPCSYFTHEQGGTSSAGHLHVEKQSKMSTAYSTNIGGHACVKYISIHLSSDYRETLSVVESLFCDTNESV